MPEASPMPEASLCSALTPHLSLSQYIPDVSHLRVGHLADGQQVSGSADGHLQYSSIVQNLMDTCPMKVDSRP